MKRFPVPGESCPAAPRLEATLEAPTPAWGSPSRVAEILPEHQQAKPLVETALESAEALPKETARQLRSRLRSGRARSPAARASAAVIRARETQRKSLKRGATARVFAQPSR